MGTLRVSCEDLRSCGWRTAGEPTLEAACEAAEAVLQPGAKRTPVLVVVGAEGAGFRLVEAALTDRLGLHPLSHHSRDREGVVEDTAVGESSGELVSKRETERERGDGIALCRWSQSFASYARFPDARKSTSSS